MANKEINAQNLIVKEANNISKVEQKPLTTENIIKAVQTLQDHRGDSYEDMKKTLDSQGFTWAKQDTMALPIRNENLFMNGVLSGNPSFGAAVVAHARSNADGFKYVRDNLLGESMDIWQKRATENERGKQLGAFDSIEDQNQLGKRDKSARFTIKPSERVSTRRLPDISGIEELASDDQFNK